MEKTLLAFFAVTVLGSVCLWPNPAVADAPQYSGSASMGYDSNPGDAESGSRVPAAAYGSAGVAAGQLFRVGPNTAMLLRASVDAQQYARYDGLSNAGATLLLRGLYRPGGGFFVPTFAVWSSADGSAFRSRLRSGGEFRGGAYAVEQLSTAISLRLGGYASERDSRSSVFTLHGRAATLDGDWLLGSRLTAHFGYEYRAGSFAVSSPADPGAAAFASAKTRDDSLSIAGVDNIVYRLDGRTQIGTLGLNYALTPALALDAQAQGAHTRAVSGDDYDRWLGELSVLVSF
jgi:hypothetical protein